jgi:AraC family transcriptional regulator
MNRDQMNFWTERLLPAFDLLSSRLNDPPSLEELATVAGFSTFHFHRIWRALLGEPVSQTVTRLRIASAQLKLHDAGTNVTRVAMDVGFATPQSFARAFRRVAGISPTEFASGEHEQFGVDAVRTAEVQVELRPSRRLVAIRRNGGSYQELNALFGQVWSFAEQRKALDVLQGIYGLPLDDPLSVPVSQLRYDACLDIGEDVTLAAPFHEVILPAGPYARIRQFGSYELEAADQTLIEWAIWSNRKPSDFPTIHLFHDDPETVPQDQWRADAMVLLEPVEE